MDDFVWEVHIIEDDEVLNAFATPGRETFDRPAASMALALRNDRLFKSLPLNC